MTIDLDAKLRERGILAQANVCRWKPLMRKLGGNEVWGWQFPLYDRHGKATNYLRWKNAQTDLTNGEYKYIWEGKRDSRCPAYYCPPGFVDAVEMSNTVHIVSGEPDVLAMREVGIFNALSWFGEMNIPDTLASFMDVFNVETVIYWPDTDVTGMKATAKVYKVLADHLRLEIRRLPYDIGEKGDINKLYQDLAFDKVEMNNVLTNCPALEDSEFMMYVELDGPQLPLGEGSGELPDEFLRAIESALGVKGFKTNGFSSNNVKCPNSVAHKNDDRKPSAQWNQRGFLKCFTCGETWKAKETGEALNIRLADYYSSPDSARKPPLDAENNSQATELPVTGPSHLRDDLRSDKVRLRLDDQIHGRRKPATRVFPFPFASMHEFGGFHKTCVTGKVTIVIAPSGGGKTMWCETINDKLNRQGINGAWWGIEWSEDEMEMRRYQRLSENLSYHSLLRHLAWYSYRDQGIPDSENMGKLLEPRELDEYEIIQKQLNEWPGTVEYFRGEENVEDTLVHMQETIEREHKSDRMVLYAIFDYIQLLTLGKSSHSANRYEQAFELLKRFASDHNIHIFATSQMNKPESSLARSESRPSMESAHYIRSDKANLALVLDQQYYSQYDGDSRPTNAFWLESVKASYFTRRGDDGRIRIPLLLRPNRLYFDETDWRRIQALPFVHLKDHPQYGGPGKSDGKSVDLSLL